MTHLTERQADKLLRKSQPVGCLHERHPRLLHAAVLKLEDGYYALIAGCFERLSAGTKVRLWGGQVVEA